VKIVRPAGRSGQCEAGPDWPSEDTAYRKNSGRGLVAIVTILIQENIENILELLIAKRPEHVVEIHEIFLWTSMLYIVSEHMEVSLSQMLCAPLKLSEEQIATICKQVLGIMFQI
jgi:hypothetical protein